MQYKSHYLKLYMSSSPKSDRSVPLKSSLKKRNEFGETSSSGVQSGSANSDADSIKAKQVSVCHLLPNTLEKSNYVGLIFFTARPG